MKHASKDALDSMEAAFSGAADKFKRSFQNPIPARGHSPGKRETVGVSEFIAV